MNKIFNIKNFFITFLLIIISGCANYKAVGKLDNYNEIMVGNVEHNLVIGGSKFEMTTIIGNGQCKGTTTPPDTIPNLLLCVGQEGSGQASCDDGKTYTLRWVATGCTTGYAKGQSSDGYNLSVTFGLSDEEAIIELEKLSDSVSNKPTVNEALAEKECLASGLKKTDPNFKLCVLYKIN